MWSPLSSALLTDLYELTMLQAYLDRGMVQTAVFELYSRKLPHGRNFLLAAGLEQALQFAAGLRFSEQELDWIERCGHFRPGFAARLAQLRFTGDIHAMPEGTVFFPDEPILRVTAPLPEAQLLETRLLNLVHFQTVVASKAARCTLVAGRHSLVDFGLRRAHGAEAAVHGARAAYVAGFAGTSNALAAAMLGIPAFGTMAHSFVQAHASEREAFAAFAAAFPANAVLLIDTYDTVQGARIAADIGRTRRLKGVRLDSGDLDALSREVRRVLDAAALGEAIIFASGNLDEYRIAELVAAGAPIDSFGVGTSVATSSDHPALDAVYKLQEYAGRARRKRSAGKATWPGRKQVYRTYASDGSLERDVVTLETDVRADEPLLRKVMEGGRPLPLPSLREARAYALSQLKRLPQRLRGLVPALPYSVEISPALLALARDVDDATASPVAGAPEFPLMEVS